MGQKSKKYASLSLFSRSESSCTPWAALAVLLRVER